MKHMKNQTEAQAQSGFDLNATNLCKGIAICIMVYYHCFGATDETMFRTLIPPLYRILGPYGNVCVPFFVLLSGWNRLAGKLVSGTGISAHN